MYERFPGAPFTNIDELVYDNHLGFASDDNSNTLRMSLRYETRLLRNSDSVDDSHLEDHS